MASTVTFRWFPERLNGALVASFAASLRTAQADAAARAPSSKAGAEVRQTGPTSALLEPTGLGAIFEEGAEPHIIKPDPGKVLFLKGLNVFTAGPVNHPGSPARPYLGPAAATWATVGYQVSARALLRLAGFS